MTWLVSKFYAWIAASAPYGVPTPCWHSVRRVPIVSEICLPTALAESLPRVHPTAIGLIPLSFSRAIRVAPKKEGRIEAGQFPLMMWLVRAVRALRSAVPPASAEAPIMSFRCWGLRLSGPLADPLGKIELRGLLPPPTL